MTKQSNIRHNIFVEKKYKMERVRLIKIYSGILLAFLFIGGPLFSQETQTNTEYTEFKDQNGYYITDMNGEKDISSFPNALEIISPMNVQLSEAHLENGISLSEFGITILDNKYNYFRIGNTGKLLVIYPEELIIQLYNKQLTDED